MYNTHNSYGRYQANHRYNQAMKRRRDEKCQINKIGMRVHNNIDALCPTLTRHERFPFRVLAIILWCSKIKLHLMR